MKTTISNKLSIVVFLLGILGAFGTMSMKQAPEVLMSGWAHNGVEDCKTEVSCSEIPKNEFCSLQTLAPLSIVSIFKEV